MKYKIGDRVTHAGYGNGTVIGHYGCGENVMAAVEFDMPQERFHRASTYGGKPGKDNHCWYVGESELTPVNNPSWVLIVRPDKADPDTTVAILKVDGKETRHESVKRYYKDEYNSGAAIREVVTKLLLENYVPESEKADEPVIGPPANNTVHKKQYTLTITDSGDNTTVEGKGDGFNAHEIIAAIEYHKFALMTQTTNKMEIKTGGKI